MTYVMTMTAIKIIFFMFSLLHCLLLLTFNMFLNHCLLVLL